MTNSNPQWEAFNNYIDILIEEQHTSMEQAEHSTIVYRCQGSVLALRKLKQLRDEVNNG
jgi:hypothetical protein